MTYQYLDRVPYGEYDKLKEQINLDIQNIDKIKKEQEPKSAKAISLKQAYDLYKKATKFQDGINKLKDGNFTDEESIKALITGFSFIFNMSRNKSQYEKNAFKEMQYIFWQTVIEIGGKYVDFSISADFLQHSLEKEPTDLFITEGKVVKEIMKDESFKKNISKIIKKYGKDCEEFIFDSKNDDEFSIRFNDKDLYYSIHNADLIIIGKKQDNEWNLEIKLHDRYDYSQPKKLMQYYNDTSSIAKSLFSSTLYNLASISVKSKVIKEYNIDIQIYLNGFEVDLV